MTLVEQDVQTIQVANTKVEFGAAPKLTVVSTTIPSVAAATDVASKETTSPYGVCKSGEGVVRNFRAMALAWAATFVITLSSLVALWTITGVRW